MYMYGLDIVAVPCNIPTRPVTIVRLHTWLLTVALTSQLYTVHAEILAVCKFRGFHSHLQI